MPRSNRTPSVRRAALCLLLVLCGGSAALAQPTLVSVNAAGTASGNGQESLNGELSLSHDGRFVVFVSDSSDLVAGDTNGAVDVFVRDLAAGTTRLVSVNAAGTASGNARSGVTGPVPVRSLSISGNGRYVAFSSAASDLVAGDTNGIEDVFVRDLQTNTTTLASVTAAGTGSGNGGSIFPFLTPDGGSVTFRSSASDLVANDTNGAALDVFVRRLTTNTTILVSVNAAGNGSGNMPSAGISTSDDGRFVTFSSRASDLVANDTNGTTFFDVFVRDLQTNTTTLVSATPGNTGSGNSDSNSSLISANGARVVFQSRASNLTATPDANGMFDVFVRDLATGTTTLVSVNRQGTAAGAQQSFFISFPVISNDGNVVVFSSNANNLTQDDTDTEPDVFVRDLAAGSTTLVSVSAFGGMSGNGGSGINSVGMSGDGRFIVFDSFASDLAGNDGDTPNTLGSADVFVRDRLTSRTLLASFSSISNLSGHGDSVVPVVSRNGAVVAFSSLADDLDPRDTDTQMDVFAVALAASDVEFTAPSFQVSEGVGAATVTVRRTGDTSTEAFVNYETGDGNATSRQDYTAAFGRLRFAPGETTKSFQVIITDDRFNDDNGVFGEGVRVTLTDPVGTTLGEQETAFVVIIDNDAADGPSPVKDASFNTEFFVRQHYADFLNRVPDAGGLQFWIDGIESCGADTQCREVKKVDTSAAFFLSIEFQETGFLAYRAHKAAFGNLPGKPVPVRLRDFLFDSRLLGENVIVGTPGWPDQLEANKLAYFTEFVQRSDFVALNPLALTAEQYVDALFARAGVLPTQAERSAAVAAFGGGGTAGRAAALRSVAESQTLRQAETNKAFVLMQYFGYLRRNPDDPQDTNFDGFFFWLQKLDQFNGNYVQAEMVKAFIQSIEYGNRFGL